MKARDAKAGDVLHWWSDDPVVVETSGIVKEQGALDAKPTKVVYLTLRSGEYTSTHMYYPYDECSPRPEGMPHQ